MKIAIIGRGDVLYKTAKLLHQLGHHICLVVTAKEAPEYEVTSSEYEKLAEELRAEFFLTNHLRSQKHQNSIKRLSPIDIAISVNYTSILDNTTINLFKHGILNAHGGDLPKYRGNACQAWAILNQEKQIGLCVHKMEGGEVDTGPIICRSYLDIDHNTKIGEVLGWFEEETPELFAKAIDLLNTDSSYQIARSDSSDPKGFRCYPRRPEDGQIIWSKTNLEILLLINASNKPYTGAFTFFKNEPVIIWEAYLTQCSEQFLAQPGQICKVCEDGSAIVATGRGKLTISIVEYKGKLMKPAELKITFRDRLSN